MTPVVFVQPLLALISGVLILIFPRILNYVIAGYLILFGLAGLFAHRVQVAALPGP